MTTCRRPNHVSAPDIIQIEHPNGLLVKQMDRSFSHISGNSTPLSLARSLAARQAIRMLSVPPEVIWKYFNTVNSGMICVSETPDKVTEFHIISDLKGVTYKSLFLK